MSPIYERKEDMTPSDIIYKTRFMIDSVISDDVMILKPEMFVEYKKRRNKMKHLTPKKKKRKK